MIFFILIYGLILRLISINQSLWLDEATSALAAKMSITQMFSHFLPGDFHPPLYYLVLKYWTTIFGYSEISLRIPSVISGVGTIYILYLIGKNLFNKRIGLIAASFLATSGLSIYYSQEARMYSLATLLVCIAIFLFLKRKWLILSIFLVLIGLTDYVSLFIIPVIVIAGWKYNKKIILSFIPLLIAFLLWSPIFVKQLAGGLSQAGTAWWNILGILTLKNSLLIPIKFILGRISFDNKLVYMIVAGITIIFFGYLLYQARKASKILWLWLFLPTILGVLVSLKIPTLSYFRFLFCLPAFYILLAAGTKKQVFIYIVLLINVITAGIYLFNPKFQREDWRAAASAIGSEKIVLPADSQKEALIYYGKGGQIVTAASLEQGDRGVWLSRYVWEIVDPKDSTRHKVESLGYNKASEYNFNGVVFWKYVKNQYAHRN